MRNLNHRFGANGARVSHGLVELSVVERFRRVGVIVVATNAHERRLERRDQRVRARDPIAIRCHPLQ